ncbi:hypothetical protein REPUB_Repub15cG0014800 [Reevesia pubescens]
MRGEGKCRTSLARDAGQLFPLQPHQFSVVESLVLQLIKVLSSSSSLKWMDCEEGYEGYEDQEFVSFELRLYDITKEDNAEKFIELIKSKIYDDADVLDSVGVPEILYNICGCHAVNCATALFQELTCLEVDVNTNLANMDVPALNVAHSNPKLVELFLRHGARTDIRSPKGRLPLNSSLYDFSNYDYFSGWSAKQSIYMMIIVLCFPKLRKELEGNILIFKATKEVEKEIYHYAEEGKLIEIAVLLMVAQKEVMSPSLFESLCGSTLDGSKSLRDFILSKIISLQVSETISVYNEDLKNKLETMMSMLQLLEVFERLGDKIDSYCSQHQQTKASNEEAAVQLACLFNDEGLAEYKDFELTDLDSQPRTLETIPSLKHEYDARDYLPLNVALEKLRLAACEIEEIGEISCNLAREGKLIELASLLMVAQERLIVTTSQGSNGLSSESDGSTRIRKCIMSDLRSVFDAEEGTRLQVAKEIQFLLKKAGFVLKHNDTDLNDLNWTSLARDGGQLFALQPHQISVVEHVFGTRRGHQKTPLLYGSAARSYHTMQNSKSCSQLVSAPTEKKTKLKASKFGMPHRKLGSVLALAVMKGMKRV